MDQKPREVSRRRSTLALWIGIAIVLLVVGIAAAVLSVRSSAPKARSEIVKLLAERVGFGAPTSGGAVGATYHVTTPDDDKDNPQPGSLRWAVNQPQPLWIVFDGDYTIRLAAGLPVSSDKAVDGQGRKVTITGHGLPGLQLTNVHNVIIENLILRDFGDVTRTAHNDPNDAIDIQGSRDVWIDHCTLSMAGDKLISTEHGSTAITVSWNHLYQQEQTVQFGAQATGTEDASTKVTVDHNFFDHTGYRNPVVSYGMVHLFDNYLLDWSLYGIRSERAAQLFAENDIFEAGDNKAATKITPGGNGCNDKKTRCDDRPGYLRITGALALNGAVLQESQPQLVFQPSAFYSYHADPAGTQLKDAIVLHAGWQPD